MSIPDLALDLFHCPAQIAGDLRDRHAVAEELVEIGYVCLRLRVAGIDVGKVGGRLLAHTRHEQEYRSGLPGIGVPV
jgi:hypothetical protein